MKGVTNPIKDVKFLNKAMLAINEARRAIAFSYPYGYFIEHVPINNLYE